MTGRFHREIKIRLTASVLISAFTFALSLSAAPHLHSWFHKDSGAINHECAATLIASGSYEHSAAPKTFVAPQPVAHFATVAIFHSVWVARLFLEASVFEHAPPALS